MHKFLERQTIKGTQEEIKNLQKSVRVRARTDVPTLGSCLAACLPSPPRSPPGHAFSREREEDSGAEARSLHTPRRPYTGGLLGFCFHLQTHLCSFPRCEGRDAGGEGFLRVQHSGMKATAVSHIYSPRVSGSNLIAWSTAPVISQGCFFPDISYSIIFSLSQ